MVSPMIDRVLNHFVTGRLHYDLPASEQTPLRLKMVFRCLLKGERTLVAVSSRAFNNSSLASKRVCCLFPPSRNPGCRLKSFSDIFRWTHWRQMSQLHQDTQIIARRPALNDFAVGESEHLHSGGSDGSAGRWLSH